MSDEKLRDLERAWKEGGAEDQARAYLTERVRMEGWPLERLVADAAGGSKPQDILSWWDAPQSAPLGDVSPGFEVHHQGHALSYPNLQILDFGYEFMMTYLGDRVRVGLAQDIQAEEALSDLKRQVAQLEGRVEQLSQMEWRLSKLER